MAITEDLELDISSALSRVDEIRIAVESITGTVAIEADTTAVTTAVDSAIESANSVVAVEADAATVTTEIEAAVEAADTSVEIKPEVDSSGVEESSKEIERSTGSASGGLAALGLSAGGAKTQLIGFAAGAVGVVTSVKFAVDSVSELQRVSALTEARIRSTGGAANVTAAQVRAYAVELEELTTIDDKLIQASENVLLGFRGVRNELGAGRDIFNQATMAALDMSTALGTDATAAAKALGRALNEPGEMLTALSRMVGGFSDEAIAKIEGLAASGDKAGAQLVILDEITARFGGSAEAVAGTLGGDLNRFMDALEDVAVSLAPALGFVADGLVRLTPLFKAAADTAGVLADIINSLPKGDAKHFFGGEFQEQVDRVNKLLEVTPHVAETAVDANQALSTAINEVATGIAAEADAFIALRVTQMQATGISRELALALSENELAHRRVAEGIEIQIGALRDLFAAENRGLSVAFDLIDASGRNSKAAKDLGEARAEVARITVDGEKKAGDLAKAEQDQADAAYDAVKASQDLRLVLAEAGVAMDVSGLSAKAIADQLAQAGLTAGLSEQEIAHLVAQVQLLGPAAASSEGAMQNIASTLALLASRGYAASAAITAAVNAFHNSGGALATPGTPQGGFDIGPGFNAAQFIGSSDSGLRESEIAFTLEKMAEATQAAREGLSALAAVRDNEVQFLKDEILTREEQIEVVNRAIAGEERYTDRWRELTGERKRLLDEQTRDQEQTVQEEERLRDEQARNVETAIRNLDTLIRQEESIQKRRVEIAERTTTDIARLEAQLADDRQRIAEELERTQLSEDRRLRDAVDNRIQELDRFASIGERFTTSPALSVERLIGNAAEQNRALEEFASQLAAVRARGVSEAVISALGLAEGPQALGQLRRFASSSDVSIAALNAEVARRGGLIGAQANVDTAGVRSEVEAAKILAAELARVQTDALVTGFEAERGRIQGAASITLAELDVDAAAIGQSVGATFGQNIAKGLTSTNAAIRQAAQEGLDLGFVAGNGEVQVIQVYVQPGQSIDDALRARR